MFFRHLGTVRFVVAASASLTGWGAGTAQTPSQIPAELTRAEARRLFLENSPLLAAEALRAEMEQADVVQAGLRPNPLLSAGSQGLGTPNPGSSPFDKQEFSVTLGLEWETGGKRNKRVRLEEAEVNVQQREAENLRRLLLFDVDRAYFELALAQADLETLQRIRDRFQRVVNLNRARFEQGEISGADLRRTEGEQYRILEDLVAAEVRVENAQDSLAALLGFTDFGRDFRAVDPLEETTGAPPPEDLAEMARREHPSLQAQRERIELSRAGVELERARAKPNLNPFGGFRRDFGSNGAIFGVEFELPWADKNQGAIARSRISQDREERLLRLSEIEVLKEVRLAWNQVQGERRKVKLLEDELLPRVRRSREIVESAYRLGAVPLLELLDVERVYDETVRRSHQARHDLRLSVARLSLAVGRDLNP